MDAKELVNIICPEHDRTSCNDRDLANGFYSSATSKPDGTIDTSHWLGRCRRCMYLELIQQGEAPAGFDPELIR